jgi:hypothetical protein
MNRDTTIVMISIDQINVVILEEWQKLVHAADLNGGAS